MAKITKQLTDKTRALGPFVRLPYKTGLFLQEREYELMVEKQKIVTEDASSQPSQGSVFGNEELRIQTVASFSIALSPHASGALYSKVFPP